MKKNVVVLSVAIAGLLAVSPVFASGTSSDDPIILNKGGLNTTQPPIIIGGGLPSEGGITPQATRGVIINDSLANTTYQRDFDVPPGYGYVKVSIKNLGSKNITFTVNKAKSSGASVLSGTIAPNGVPKPFYTPALAVGTYVITVSSGSATMSGTVGVRLGTNLDELKADN